MQYSEKGDLPFRATHRSLRIAIKSVVVLSVLACILYPTATNAVFDPPHTEPSGVLCADCHGEAVVIAGGSPFWTDNKADSAYNALCLTRCHTPDKVPPYDGPSAPPAASHAPGGTVIKCTTCHHNHEQDQIYTGVGAANRDKFFLATGTATSAVYDGGSDTTTITYTGFAASNPGGDWASDLTMLSAKSGTGRGGLLIPDRNYRRRSPLFMIKAIDDPVVSTIIVKGDASSATDFAIIYGQLIRGVIECDDGNKTVQFYDARSSSSFTSASGSGICQICHDYDAASINGVKYWAKTGEGQNHYPGRNCMGCHFHTDSFVHGGGSNACENCHGHDDGFGGGTYYGTTQTHSRHTENDIGSGGDDNGPPLFCTDCHSATYPYFKSGTDLNGDSFIDLSETDVCAACHNQKPSWGGSGCLSCHTGSVANRADVGGQFAGNSHHVQGVPVDNVHCYECHWEAFEDGTINTAYHGGTKAPDSAVDLVISEVLSRPTTYTNGVTAITFTPANMSGSLAADRQAVENISIHCLGCHREENNSYMPFNDCRTPSQYAWDLSSIGQRYTDLLTTTWGKYSSVNTAPKGITKAYSAHGNAVNNGGGFSMTEGEDGTITNTRDGLGGTRNYNVECFDCHNSHGSSASGITSSYISFTGSKNGGIPKETQAGKGGYTYAYSASENTDGGSINPYSQGAGLCFDCHDNSAEGTLVDTGSNTPWGYNDTYGATGAIRGYRDTERFGQGTRGLTNIYPYKNATLVGGHFKVSSALEAPAMSTIEGLCTPCHDPHGLSSSLGDDKPYALPLLKGTWMTSPYKEDIAASMTDGTSGSNYYAQSNSNQVNYDWLAAWKRPPPNRPDGFGPGGWRTDRNTFNQADRSIRDNHPAQYDRITEDPARFAGLCLRCHPKDSLTTEVSAEATATVTWGSKERIHRTVKGWGWDPGDPQREHSFTCSKCHSPHASGLPRLMKTNCLNYPHRGRAASGGTIIDSVPNSYDFAGGRFPYGWWTKGELPPMTLNICHGSPTANGTGGYPDNQDWNDKTPW